MVFAGQVDLSAGILFPNKIEEAEEQPMSEYMQKIINCQNELMTVAIKNQNDADMFHLSENSGLKYTEFPVESYVSVALENGEHKPPTKLHAKRRGPFQIIRKT